VDDPFREIGLYKLTKDHKVVRAEYPYDLEEVWAEGNRRVGRTMVGRYEVSTVFLPIDHSFGRGESHFFETMVFDTEGGDENLMLDQYMERCSTWAEAVAQHERVCAYVALKQGLPARYSAEAG
jgi:hypothetical protein